MKRIVFWIFKRATAMVAGKGLGKLTPLRKLYAAVSRHVVPESEKIVHMDGFDMRITTDKRGLDGMTATLVGTGKYEPMTTSVFRKVLRKGMNVVDVGANIGYFTLLSSKIVGEKATVYAFEPEADNFYNLECNLRLNYCGNARPYQLAMSDTCGTAEFYVSKDESGEHSLIAGRSHIKDTVTVTVETLDNIVDKPIGLLKTDTEGNDPAVLRGGIDILYKNTDIVVITEFWLPGLGVSSGDPARYWELLRSFGFDHIYIADEIRKEIVPGTFDHAVARCQGGRFSVNLVCARREIEGIVQ